MANPRPYSGLIERLKAVGLRPTRQRLALAKLLFGPGNRHVTAEQLQGEAGQAEVRGTRATVQNRSPIKMRTSRRRISNPW